MKKLTLNNSGAGGNLSSQETQGDFLTTADVVNENFESLKKEDKKKGGTESSRSSTAKANTVPAALKDIDKKIVAAFKSAADEMTKATKSALLKKTPALRRKTLDVRVVNTVKVVLDESNKGKWLQGPNGAYGRKPDTRFNEGWTPANLGRVKHSPYSQFVNTTTLPDTSSSNVFPPSPQSLSKPVAATKPEPVGEKPARKPPISDVDRELLRVLKLSRKEGQEYFVGPQRLFKNEVIQARNFYKPTDKTKSNLFTAFETLGSIFGSEKFKKFAKAGVSSGYEALGGDKSRPYRIQEYLYNGKKVQPEQVKGGARTAEEQGTSGSSFAKFGGALLGGVVLGAIGLALSKFVSSVTAVGQASRLGKSYGVSQSAIRADKSITSEYGLGSTAPGLRAVQTVGKTNTAFQYTTPLGQALLLLGTPAELSDYFLNRMRDPKQAKDQTIFDLFEMIKTQSTFKMQPDMMLKILQPIFGEFANMLIMDNMAWKDFKGAYGDIKGESELTREQIRFAELSYQNLKAIKESLTNFPIKAIDVLNLNTAVTELTTSLRGIDNDWTDSWKALYEQGANNWGNFYEHAKLKFQTLDSFNTEIGLRVKIQAKENKNAETAAIGEFFDPLTQNLEKLGEAVARAQNTDILATPTGNAIVTRNTGTVGSDTNAAPIIPAVNIGATITESPATSPGGGKPRTASNATGVPNSVLVSDFMAPITGGNFAREKPIPLYTSTPVETASLSQVSPAYRR